MVSIANLDESVLRNGCIDQLTPRGNTAGEVGNVRKSLVCQKMRHSHRPATRVAHHDGFHISGQFGQAFRYLIHGHMYDARNARKLQFPLLADVDDHGILPAIAPRLEFRCRNLTNHGRSELERLGTGGVIERVDGRLEQSAAAPGGIRGPGDQQRFLRLFGADHGEKFPTHG